MYLKRADVVRIENNKDTRNELIEAKQYTAVALQAAQ